MTRRVSVLTPCYNEEHAIRECYETVREVFATELSNYEYEHLFIDNCSQDQTVAILRDIAAGDRNVKIIVNSRNFGHARSPHHAMLQAEGDAVVGIAADLQTPPALIPELVRQWESGFPMVLGIRIASEEGWLMRRVRSLFYRIMARVSNIQHIPNFIGFGLYDRRVVEVLRTFNDPEPYFRGMVVEIGFDKAFVDYHQQARKHGASRHSFFQLLDFAILGLTSYSKVPLRLMTVGGLILSILGLVTAFVYFVRKLLFWDEIVIGIAPLVIGTFFFASVQLFCIGLLGEYVGSIFEHVRRRPLVVEKERINFD
jgi:glycosyltransferase involved in cell wall biosynthesis